MRIGSHKAYVYIRGEYFRPAQRFSRAVEEAHAHGWLGKNIQGSGFDLDVVIHRGAGAYICGEETALLTSLEGGKGFPKLKPPFPAISGLFQCPTIVNNVETLACVPFILREGAERFARLGTATQGGTRLFSVCGHVNRPGLYEAPVGVTLRELIEGYAQGVRGGRKLKAVIPGGISAKVLTAAEIDVQMDFDSLMAAGIDGRIRRRDRDGRHHVHGRGAAVRVEVLRARVVRPVFALPGRNRLGSSHRAVALPRARGGFRTWTICWPLPATWRARRSVCSPTRRPGRSSPTSRSSARSSKNTSGPGRCPARSREAAACPP